MTQTKNRLALFATAAALAVLTLSIPLMAQDGPDSITINTMPSNPEEFTSLRDEIATTPEGGAAMFIIALMAHSEDQELGLKFLTIALDRSQLAQGNAYKAMRPTTPSTIT